MSRSPRPFLRDRLVQLSGARASRFAAARLLQEAGASWSADPRRAREAIDKLERAWALDRDPEIAIQLTIMYDRVNRNEEAIAVLTEASKRHSRHGRLRYHTAITLLRHGSPAAIREFFDAVLAVDPDDAFARFITSLLDAYDGWTAALAQSMERERDGRQPFMIAVPVWGEGFAAFCMRNLCASFLSPHNLPALGERHSVHIAFFTSAEAEAVLRGEPLFKRLEQHATIDVVRYPPEVMAYKDSMNRCYGGENVPFSNESLAFYYERNCKFALMSCAHYVGLAAGRAVDGVVSCMVADVIVNDGALTTMAMRIADADAVLAHAIQMPGSDLRPVIDTRFRSSDGVLSVPADECGRLIVEFMPANNLAESGILMDPPLRLAWRVGAHGLLVHGNHFHPYCLRPKALDHPLQLSIDPVDSRFMDRVSLGPDRLHLVQDSSVVVLSIDDDPILHQRRERTGGALVSDFALWLWGYWSPLRGRMFRTPLRFGATGPRAQWEPVEAEALTLVDAIIAETQRLEGR